MLDHHDRLMRLLEKTGGLNRSVEYLPDDEALAERAAAKRGLTRPEIAVLLAYGKIWLYDHLLNSDLPDHPFLVEELVRYFPSALQGEAAGMAAHRLRREIVATQTTNSMINRVGGTFVSELAERAGASPVDVARAYLVVRDAFGLRELWQAVEVLDNQVPAAVQTAMLMEANRLVFRCTLWLLRYGPRPSTSARRGRSSNRKSPHCVTASTAWSRPIRPPSSPRTPPRCRPRACPRIWRGASPAPSFSPPPTTSPASAPAPGSPSNRPQALFRRRRAVRAGMVTDRRRPRRRRRRQRALAEDGGGRGHR